jgi:streptomycin 6-kinase
MNVAETPQADDETHAHARRWGLTSLQPLATTANARLWTADMAGHGRVVLKVLTPRGADEAIGAALLRWLDGDGAVRLLARTPEAMVLEHVPGPLLGDLVRQGRDLEATQILAGIAAGISRHPGLPRGLTPLDRALDRLLGDHPWPDALTGPVGRARHLARDLLATAPAARPLHGDLHHDNILHAARGWLAIDPKGYLGDPAFDLANSFRNPFDRQDLARDPARARALARVHAQATGLPERRLLGWAAALCATSAGWNLDAGNAIADDLALLEPFLAIAA